jgi:tyrosine-protein kinase Etk/Wzc
VYDLVVIDSAPLLAVAETIQIVPSAGSIAFCVRMDLTTEDQAIAGRDTLARAPAKPTGLVLTDLAASERRHGYYSYAYAYRSGSQTEESKV